MEHEIFRARTDHSQSLQIHMPLPSFPTHPQVYQSLMEDKCVCLLHKLSDSVLLKKKPAKLTRQVMV